MSTGVDCAVYIDGERVADGRDGDDPFAPTVLSGLSFTWGRDSTVDQPAASSCAFTLMDDLGGSSFLTTVRTGVSVDVTATGTIYGSAEQSTVDDPGFEQTAPGVTPANVRTTNAAAAVVVDGAARALQLLPLDASAAAQTTIAPRGWSSSPAAWDDIPTTAGGQTWQISVGVVAPPMSEVTLQPVLIHDPAGARVEPAGAPVPMVGTGAPVTLSTVLVPAVAGVWVGVRLRVFPTGPRWSDATGTWAQAVGTWAQRAAVLVDDVQILAPEGGTTRTVLAFSGRITDVDVSYDTTLDGPAIAVTAVDFTADLDNVRIGDEPWAREPFQERFRRVLQLAGLQIDAVIPDTIAGIPLAYQDVDAQAATGLLKDYAQSVDAVMWSATHQATGPYVSVEDPASRQSLYELVANVDDIVVIAPVAVTDGQQISACDVLRDPVQWEQSVSDVATRVAVTWLEESIDEEGQTQTTERTVTVVDSELEQRYGRRGISVSTLLATPDDAQDIALRILARTSITGWRASGITIDDDESLQSAGDVAVAMLLRLLDGTARNGLPVLLTDLPDWSPLGPTLPVYLEGGTYTHVAGTWTLELTVSRAEGQGTSAPWGDLDAGWAWVDIDPEISWEDLVGVAAGGTP